MGTIRSLTTLPLEIQHAIANCLTARDSWQCSAVSRSWRSLFLSNDCVWEKLSTEGKHNIVPELLPYRQCIRSSAVKILDAKVKESSHLQEIIKFLDSVPCRSVKKVCLKAPDLSSTVFFGFMNNSSASLVYIDINLYATGARNVTPDTILRHCPNLRGLYFVGSIDDTQKTDGLWCPTLDFKHQNLVKLLLDYRESLHGNFDVRPFLEALPKLRKLFLVFEDIENSGFPTADFLQFTPELTELELYHGSEYFSNEKIEFAPLVSEGEGLEDFRAALYLESPAAQTLIQDITRTQCRSLNYMEFEGEESLSLSLLLSVSGSIFESLVRLTLANADDGDPLALCAILLRSCPNLVHLRLHHVLFANDDVLSACLGPVSLGELEIWDCWDISAAALANVLTWMGRDTFLYHLSFNDMAAVTSAVLDAIAGLEYLEYLWLGECRFLTAEDFERFLDTTKQTEKKFHEIHFIATVLDLETVPDSETAQRILRKLDAKACEWKFGLDIPLSLRKDRPELANCPYISITHEEYRNSS
ncbi:hypothetical protein BJV82DRAFT_573240 [Fennellomyces sp. T-0311]|nr:hypothetical protein BJV82DRAFT_573240 [Fennellomyces sp. T-0311]